MNWEAIGAIGEMIGALAVFASLLFVGLQIRQSDRTQRAVSLQSVLDGHRDRTFAPLYMTQDVGELWSRGMTSFDELEESDKRRFFAFMFEQCFQMQQVMQLSERGLLPSTDFDAWLAYTASVFQSPGGKAIWPIMRTTVTPTVAILIDEYLEKHPDTPSFLDLNPLFSCHSMSTNTPG